MRIVVAPDSFKGSAAAVSVAAAIAEGWRSRRPDDEVRLLPMADGGEGTLDAFASAVAGSVRRPVVVPGPDGRAVHTAWLLLPDGTGVVELAATSGLTLLERPAPMTAHVLGFGQALAAALDGGAQRLLLAVGGSASTDGGASMLAALGARVVDAAGEPVALGGGGLESVHAVDLHALRPLPPGGAVLLVDVDNPLLGSRGAVAVFAEQKGADATQRAALEQGMTRWAGLLPADPATPGAGAAGGTGFAALVWGARPASGAAAVADAIGLGAALEDADLVVTGEGRFDAQTAAGKVPAVVAAMARAAGVPTALVAGQVTVHDPSFAAVRSLADLAGGAEAAMADASAWLRAAGASLAADLPGA